MLGKLLLLSVIKYDAILPLCPRDLCLETWPPTWSKSNENCPLYTTYNPSCYTQKSNEYEIAINQQTQELALPFMSLQICAHYLLCNKNKWKGNKANLDVPNTTEARVWRHPTTWFYFSAFLKWIAKLVHPFNMS